MGPSDETLMGKVVSHKTPITIGVVFAVLGGVAPAVAWLDNRLDNIERVLLVMETREHEPKTTLEVWAQLLQAQNPDLNVPKVPGPR